MTSNSAVIDDLQRIGAIEDARVNDSGSPGEYAATVIGEEFQADWFDLCQWDYRIRTVDGRYDSGLQLTFDRLVDTSEFVFSQ
ncbi:MAG: hypothetical protein ABEH59_10925 [Halobacteriales archaeon]